MQSATRRIGMITPSSNTVLEPMTSELAREVPGLSVHFTRLRVTRISLDATDTDQFNQESLVQAAQLLADAEVEVIAWNGTSGSWLGPEYDARVCGEIERHTGRPATTATLATLAALEACEVTRLGLVTPYTDDIAGDIAANYAARGFPVHAGRHFRLSTNFDFARAGDGELDTAFEQLVEEGCDAVAILCTNLRAAHLAERWETRTGVTVIDSVGATLWESLRRGGRPVPVSGYGRLLAGPERTVSNRNER